MIIYANIAAIIVAQLLVFLMRYKKKSYDRIAKGAYESITKDKSYSREFIHYYLSNPGVFVGSFYPSVSTWLGFSISVIYLLCVICAISDVVYQLPYYWAYIFCLAAIAFQTYKPGYQSYFASADRGQNVERSIENYQRFFPDDGSPLFGVFRRAGSDEEADDLRLSQKNGMKEAYRFYNMGCRITRKYMKQNH